VSELLALNWLSDLNAQAVSRRQKAVFIWREVSRVVVGPLVLPGESACLECYRSRVRFYTSFPDEFEAYAALDPKNMPLANRVRGELGYGLIRAFVARYLLLLSRGAYELFNPGTLYGIDLISLETTRQPILKLPRCAVCGRLSHKPEPAIRSIS
jgi:hypothetical protein